MLNGIAKNSSADPELLLLEQRSHKWHLAHREKHWSAVNRWEKSIVTTNGGFCTRGELIDYWVSDLISICTSMGFEIDNEQTLRDDVFDYVRSVSYK